MAIINKTWEQITDIYEMTKWSLYAQLTKPDLTSNGIFYHNESITLNITNGIDFVTNTSSPLRFVNLSQMDIVSRFFEEKEFLDRGIANPTYLKPGTYDFNEIQKHFGNADNSHVFQQMDYMPLGSTDYDTRVYVWNSQDAYLGNIAKFVVTENGERYIQDAAPTFNSTNFDNFDFV